MVVSVYIQYKLRYSLRTVQLHERLVGVPHAVEQTVPQLGKLKRDVRLLLRKLERAQHTACLSEGHVTDLYVVRG